VSNVTDYLARSFQRHKDVALEEADNAETRVMRKASAAGALQSGTTLLLVKEEREKILRASATKMAKLAFNVTGEADPSAAADVLESGLRNLRDGLQQQLRDFYTRSAWASDLGSRLETEFLQRTDEAIAGIVDDFRHGISEGVRMKQDPLVNIVTSVTDSPGAVVQGGIGNLQRNISAGASANIRKAIIGFVNSPEVQGLPPEIKQNVIDVADVLTEELEKPAPDASRIARWGRKLLAIAEDLGIQVASSGISEALFGGG